MSTTNESGLVTRTPDADIPKFSRLQRTATGVAVAAVASRTYGTALRHGYAVDSEKGQEDISVKLKNAPGTHFAIFVDAVVPGDEFEGAANGQVQKLNAGTALGVVESSANAGAVGEVTYY